MQRKSANMHILAYSNALLQVIQKQQSTHSMFYVTALTQYKCSCCKVYKLVNCVQTQRNIINFMRSTYNVKNVHNIKVLQRNTLAFKV